MQWTTTEPMRVTILRTGFTTCTLLLSLIGMLSFPLAGSARADDKTGVAIEAHTQTESSLEVRGEVTNPRRIDAAELRKLPRAETRMPDPHNPGKEIVYSGTPLIEVLRVGGLRLESGEAGFRETVTITVLVDGSDGYRAVFAFAELSPDFSDQVILLADTRDGRPLPPREGPFRIVVPGEKRPTRWVRQVTAVEVRQN
jgi:DMSO/TMAO reductase YedYZ molybdopterin-dependent catalytic subunit